MQEAVRARTKCRENSDCSLFRFLFEDFRLCSRYNNVNYGAWHVFKPFFDSSVTICRLPSSEFRFQIKKKKLEESPGKGRT